MNQYETADGEWILLAMVQEDRLWPGLCRALERTDLLEELWLITHPGLRRSARIRAVFDFLAQRFEEARELFAGRA